MEGRVQIDRFAAKNFRSIQECDVTLAPLTFLIGANGAGKTNFINGILFVASALQDSVPKVIGARGGIWRHPLVPSTDMSLDFQVSSQSIMLDQLYTAGQLLRQGGLVR